MIQMSLSKTLCILTLAASSIYILLGLLLREINLGSIMVSLLIIITCLSGLSKSEACEIRTEGIIQILLALLLLTSSIYAQALPYELLIIYPLMMYFSMEGNSHSLLSAIVLLFSVFIVFSGHLFLFGIDTTHHAARVITIMREGKLPAISFVDPMYRYLPFYHVLHTILSEISGINPAFPYVFSFLTYGILGIVIAPYLISEGIGGKSLVPSLLLIGLPLTFVFILSPIPEAYSLVLCLLSILPFFRTSLNLRKDIFIVLLLFPLSFFFHPVPTVIFVTVAFLLYLGSFKASEPRRVKLSLLAVLAAILYVSYSLGLVRRFIAMIGEIKFPIMKELLSLKIVAYSIDLSNPINSFLILVNYALLLALSMISIRKRNQVMMFLSSVIFILLGIVLSLTFHTTAFYRYFGTPILFLLAVLAGQGLKDLRCKGNWKILASVLIAIFTSSFIIGAVIPPNQPLSQETAYLYKGMPREQDVRASSFLGRYASGVIFTDYRIGPAVVYYSVSYGNVLKVRVFSPARSNINSLKNIIMKKLTLLRERALIEMNIVSQENIEYLNESISIVNTCYSSGNTLVTYAGSRAGH